MRKCGNFNVNNFSIFDPFTRLVLIQIMFGAAHMGFQKFTSTEGQTTAVLFITRAKIKTIGEQTFDIKDKRHMRK